MVLLSAPRYPNPMADIFDVIADPTRRELLELLGTRHEHAVGAASAAGISAAGVSAAGISVGDIVASIGLSQPTVSKHLKVLRDHGLVTVREDGQHRYYRLERAPLKYVEAWLVPFLSRDAESQQATRFAPSAGVGVANAIGRTAAAGAELVRTVIHRTGARVSMLVPKGFTATFRQRRR